MKRIEFFGYVNQGRNIMCMFYCGLLILNAFYSLKAQTVIGGLTPDPSAMLDVQSNQKGVLFPRMTTAERDAITNAAPGLIIFNTTENRLQLYMGSSGNAYWWNMALEPLGTIAYLDCAGAVLTGGLFSSVEAQSVNISVPYTGGNGGAHLGQIVNSTGVTGLTATLLAGSFASGSGSLTYSIVGTPAAIGTAPFALNIGGKTCNVNVPVQLLGTISSLNCASSALTGNLYSGQAASSVSVSVPYTGGNSGAHLGQTVTSSGVTGLTATLTAGTFASGSGNLSYAITGTPSSTGTASFALNIGGQSCALDLAVQVFGTLTAVDCNAVIRKGEMQPNFAASGVTIIVPYTGGNGGAHSGQIINSTGVSGYTATLAAGNFATGNGTLTYTIEGTATTAGTATFALNIGGQNCSLDLTVQTCGAFVNGVFKVFGCYNLGAYNTRVNAFTPSWEIIGDYWQWGIKTRAASGPVGPSSNQANAGAVTGWNQTRQPELSWASPMPAANNPCPDGFRVPTRQEWDFVRNDGTQNPQSNVGTNWGVSNTNYTTGKNFGSSLFLPAAGSRGSNNGGWLGGRGNQGRYWSVSVVPGSNPVGFGILFEFQETSTIGTGGLDALNGMSIRCIEN